MSFSRLPVPPFQETRCAPGWRLYHSRTQHKGHVAKFTTRYGPNPQVSHRLENHQVVHESSILTTEVSVRQQRYFFSLNQSSADHSHLLLIVLSVGRWLASTALHSGNIQLWLMLNACFMSGVNSKGNTESLFDDLAISSSNNSLKLSVCRLKCSNPVAVS